MAVKLISRQNDSIREWAAQPYQAVQQNAQAHTQYELMDENGNPIHDYTATIQDGNLLIDVAGTSASPDFILNHYTQYFTEPPTQGTGLFGASEAVHSEAVKASTVSTADSEGLGNVLGNVLGIGAAAGLAYFVKKKLDEDDDKKNPPSAQSNSNTTPDVSTTPTTSQTNNNPANTNNNTPKPSGEKDFMHGNEIKLPTAYTQQVLSGNDMNAITQAGRGGFQMNPYQSSEENKKIIISDLNNLPREVQLELSLFVAGLLNPIREKWGVGLLKVTEGAMNFAQDIANEYTNNQKSIFNGGHYVEGIQRAAAKYGLNTNNNFYENLGGMSSSRGFKNISLDDLKREVYHSVLRMLFEDARSEHGHAKSLLNAMSVANQDSATDYLGVDTSNAKSSELNMHFIQATDTGAYIKDQAKFNTTIATPELTKMSHDGMAYYIRPDHDEETDKPSFVTYQEYNEDKSQANASDDDANHHDATQNTFLLSQLVDGNIHQLMNQYSEKSVLQLPQNTFSALLSDLSNLNEHIDYHKETGILTYDADGQTGEMEAVAIAQLPTQLNPDQLHFEVV